MSDDVRDHSVQSRERHAACTVGRYSRVPGHPSVQVKDRGASLGYDPGVNSRLHPALQSGAREKENRDKIWVVVETAQEAT